MAVLSNRQRRGLTALLCAPSIAAAAKQSHIGERTFRRWLNEPTFQAQYQQESHRLLQDATGRLRAASGEAVDVLRTMLCSQTEGIRLRAATAILDAALKVLNLDELVERIAALERGMAPDSRGASTLGFSTPPSNGNGTRSEAP